MARTEFDRDQYAEAYPPGIERSWWHVARNRVIARTFARHVPRGARALEVGCGTGIVTAQLRANGWDATGVDLGVPTTGVLGRDHLLRGTDALTLPLVMRERIDAIALFDVIEHIADAPAFLRSLLAAFPNARHLVITVPARQELWTNFDDHFGHFRRYDRRMLREEFTASGTITDHLSYFFHGLYPAIALNNLVRGRERNIRITAPAPGVPSAINAALGSIFALESMLLPAGLAGSSIIGVAHRN